MRARSLWFVGPRRVEIRPVELDGDDPARPVIRTVVSGISTGTELLAYRGEIDPSVPLDDALGALGGTFAFPFRYGYSCVGRVERPSPSFPEGASVFAFHPHQDFIAVDPADAILVDGIEPHAATMLPLVETALQVSMDAGAGPGEVVVVAGLGVVGLLTSLLLQRSGADVMGIEPRLDRRKLANDLGVVAIEPGEIADAVDERTDGAGADLAIEASGRPDALAAALGLLRHEGLALVASWYGTRRVELPLGGPFHRRRLTIRSTQVSTIPAVRSGRWDRARRLRVARDLLPSLPLDAIGSKAFPFERASDAFEALDRGEPGVAHATLVYGGRERS